MSELLTHAQLVMLAQILDVPVERVEHLGRLGADQVRALRERISDLLFDEQAETFRRVSGLGPVIPAAVVAKVAQLAVPPLVAGMAGGALGVAHTDKAAGVLSRLSPEYMADAAPYLDPRAVRLLAPVIPPGPLIPAAEELLRRRDYITAARFLEFATPELIAAFEPALRDDEGVLRVAAYTHSDERLSDVVRSLPPARVSSIVATGATGDTELRLATISLLSRLDDELKRQVGDILFDELDAEAVAAFLATVVAEGAVGDLLAVLGRLSPAALDMAAANPILVAQRTLEALVAEAASSGLWHGLLDVLERAGTDVRHRAVRVLEDQPEHVVVALGEVAARRHLWPILLRILAEEEPAAQRRLALAWRSLDAPAQQALRSHAQDLRLEEALEPLLSGVGRAAG